jgi:hydroxymethylpyrimidine pyrophosphatase-like HAD family hydrolase
MLFCSDLDQTLIYSRKSFRLSPGVTVPAVQLIETHNGQDISFMTDSGIQRLQQLAATSSFVPVTTRSVEQYQRIILFRDSLIPPFAIMSNGGNILVGGKMDQAWNQHIKLKVAQTSLEAASMLARFQEIRHDVWASRERVVDGLFYYFLVERSQLPLEDLAIFAQWAQAQNWRVSLQGRKLYIVPAAINKAAAVHYIKDILQENLVVAAGDSLLDIGMLKQADWAIAPCHGEIWEACLAGTLEAAAIHFTSQAGILAADEILDYAATCAVAERSA